MRVMNIVSLGAMLVLPLHAAPARAQLGYVSVSGNDGNVCSLAAPCRLLQRAVNVVPAGGVVEVLNSAAYGNVTIAKSLTIFGGGHTVALGPQRIRINSAGAVVVQQYLRR